MQIKNRKTNNKGITLIALVITIIVLLILAGVAIATLTGDNGVLTKAVTAKDRTTEAEAKEAVQLEAIGSIDNAGKFNKEDFKTNVKKNLGLTDSNIKDNGNTIKVTYKGYDVTVDATTGKVTTVAKAGETPPAGDYNTGTTVAEAIEQDKPYENNTTITDEFGNKVKVPAGFKIVKDNPTDPTPSVKDGIVIQDAMYEGTIESEFVWIPVGTIKTSGTETVTINLGRYSFSSTGEKSDYSGGNKEENSKDTSNLLNYGNAIATDIEDFKLKASAERSGGYYIGRYEARVDNATLDETEIQEPGPYGYYGGSDEMWTGYTGGQLVTKPNSQVWNYVTQNKASELSKNMYIGETFTSDLMNSYAWDTATLFLQTFDDRTLEGKKVYSRQNSLNTGSPANQGTNKLETAKQDKICNVWDMASNCYEWTTETSVNTNYPCVYRGGYYNNSGYYTSFRDVDSTTYAHSGYTFRPLLYL